MCSAPVTFGSGIMIVCGFLSGFGIGVEVARLFPEPVPAGLSFLRIVLLGQLAGVVCFAGHSELGALHVSEVGLPA